VHSALGLAWLAAALDGAPLGWFALEAGQSHPGPEVRLPLGLFALLLSAVELAVILAALPATTAASRNRPGAS
jgi:hypothetical protein